MPFLCVGYLYFEGNFVRAPRYFTQSAIVSGTIPPHQLAPTQPSTLPTRFLASHGTHYTPKSLAVFDAIKPADLEWMALRSTRSLHPQIVEMTAMQKGTRHRGLTYIRTRQRGSSRTATLLTATLPHGFSSPGFVRGSLRLSSTQEHRVFIRTLPPPRTAYLHTDFLQRDITPLSKFCTGLLVSQRVFESAGQSQSSGHSFLNSRRGARVVGAICCPGEGFVRRMQARRRAYVRPVSVQIDARSFLLHIEGPDHAAANIRRR